MLSGMQAMAEPCLEQRWLDAMLGRGGCDGGSSSKGEVVLEVASRICIFFTMGTHGPAWKSETCFFGLGTLEVRCAYVGDPDAR